MELFGAGVQHIGGFFGDRRCVRLFFRFQPAVTGGIINADKWLHIVAIDIEQNAFSVIFYGFCFHLYAAGYQIVPFIIGCDTIEYMVVCFLDVVSYHVFKWQHAGDIQIPGTGNQVLLVGIFSSQLVSDQMAAVIQIFSVHTIIFHGLPAGGLDRTNGTTAFHRHQIGTNVGICHTTTAQLIQLTVCLKGLFRQVRFVEIRLVVIDFHIGITGVVRNIRKGIGGGGRLGPKLHRTARQKQHRQQKRDQKKRKSFHRCTPCEQMMFFLLYHRLPGTAGFSSVSYLCIGMFCDTISMFCK